MIILATKGWDITLTLTLVFGIIFIILTIITILIFRKKLQNDKLIKSSFAFNKNKFWIHFSIRYVFVAIIILLICGAIICWTIFATSLYTNF